MKSKILGGRSPTLRTLFTQKTLGIYIYPCLKTRLSSADTTKNTDCQGLIVKSHFPWNLSRHVMELSRDGLITAKRASLPTNRPSLHHGVDLFEGLWMVVGAYISPLFDSTSRRPSKTWYCLFYSPLVFVVPSNKSIMCHGSGYFIRQSWGIQVRFRGRLFAEQERYAQ